jgi:DDE family transposase
MKANQVAEIAAALPLAEASYRLLRLTCDEERLNELYELHRGRGYEKLLTFPQMVELIGAALVQAGGRAYPVLSKADEAGELDTSLVAVYGKLARLNIDLSMAFLSDRTDPLRAIFPAGARRQSPPSLRRFATVILDGKAIKRVAKRLKPLRGTAGGLLGGRTLVALDYATGLAIAMHAEADGDANDARFVPDLLPVVRSRVSGCRLWLTDRGFCDLNRLADFSAEGDHFLVRFHPKNGFHRDESRPVRRGKDAPGRRFVEEWGWLGSERHKLRRYVRRITLERPGEEAVILVTDLLSSDDYPAAELLAHYLERWGIERMFQQVTETFGLESLIGGTPQATIFQFSFCLLLYNVLQTIRGFVAQAQRRETETISLENMFRDVREELTTWTVLERKDIVSANAFAPLSIKELAAHLEQLLRHEWSNTWIKARNKRPRRPAPHATQRTHNSVHRILQNAKQRC